jgi:DNA-binding Lrp family transcriptional regulator
MSARSTAPRFPQCNYHDTQRSTTTCFDCKAKICDHCTFEWAEYSHSEARIIIGIQRYGANIDHRTKLTVCPHCFLSKYLHPINKKNRSYYRGIGSVFRGIPQQVQRAKHLIRNWEQRQLAQGQITRLLCRTCEEAWHYSTYDACFACASQAHPALREMFAREYHHPWCQTVFTIRGDPRETYARLPQNQKALCSFFRCKEIKTCEIRFSHDPRTRITYFNRLEEVSSPTAFVFFRPDTKYSDNEENLYQALKEKPEVKKVYRVTEDQSISSGYSGYSVMAIIQAPTTPELKEVIHDCQVWMGNWIARMNAFLWPP